jgi:hypothetical protein
MDSKLEQEFLKLWTGGPYESGEVFLRECTTCYQSLSERERAEFKMIIREFPAKYRLKNRRIIDFLLGRL